MTQKACCGGRAADQNEGQQHGGFGALSQNKRTTIKVLRDYTLARTELYMDIK